MARTYQTIISVLDQLSAPVLAMEKRLEHLGQVGSKAQQQLHAAPHQRLWADLHEHIGGAHERLSGFGEQAKEAGGRVSEVLPMLAGIGAIGSIAGLVEMVRTTSEASLQLQHMATVAGVSTQQLQALDYAGTQVGVSNDAIATAMGRLNQRLGMVATGQMKPLASMLRHFGIATRDAHHHLLDAAQVLPKVSDMLLRMKDPVAQNTAAFELFGRSYQDILPLLDLGSAKLAALQGQFTLLSSFRDAILAINLAVEANPLGALIVGAALAGVAAYELYEHWDWVSKELSATWKWIEKEFDAVFKPIEKTIDQLGNDLSALQNALGYGGGGGTPTGPSQTRMPDGNTFHHGFRGGGYFKQTSFIAGGAQQSDGGGKHELTVKFDNAPDGMRVKSRSSGNASASRMNVGRNRTLEA